MLFSAAFVVIQIWGLFDWNLDLCYNTWLQQLIGILRNVNPIPALNAVARQKVQNAHGVSACDVVCLLRDCVRSAGLVWVREVRAGGLWSTCQTSEQSLVWDHDNIEMSGDNEDTQTAEETSVDEKVTLTVQSISSWAATVAPLTLLWLTLCYT